VKRGMGYVSMLAMIAATATALPLASVGPPVFRPPERHPSPPPCFTIGGGTAQTERQRQACASSTRQSPYPSV